MATGNTSDGTLNLPYPLETDPVNVHGDIESLVDRLKIVLPPLGLSQFQVAVRNSTGSLLIAGTPVYTTGSVIVNSTPRVTVEKSLPETTNPILGLMKTDLEDGSDGLVVVAGVMDNINTSDFNNGDVLYVGAEGGLTNIRPENGSGAVGIVAHAGSTGVIIVEAKGNGTWGALRDGLA